MLFVLFVLFALFALFGQGVIRRVALEHAAAAVDDDGRAIIVLCHTASAAGPPSLSTAREKADRCCRTRPVLWRTVVQPPPS